MLIAITGSTGFIGTALTQHLIAAGHAVVPVKRPQTATGGSIGSRSSQSISWDPEHGKIDSEAFNGVDAIVHLAGYPIAERRWTPTIKQQIRNSRLQSTELIARAMSGLTSPPKVLISGSAIGYYGDTADDVVDETSPAGSGFLADVVQKWESAAAPAADAGVRTVLARTGIVLDASGGPLRSMLLPFKLGLGGRSGSGKQWMSWISLHDELAAITFLLDSPVDGPVNLTAPEPTMNKEFAATLCAAVHRPCTRIPMAGPRLLFGRELADTLLLQSQRVRPTVLERTGFQFAHREIEAGIAAALAKR